MLFKKDEVINKRYEISKPIHESSNSEIYRAFDNLDGKFVIIKFLVKDTDDRLLSELFRREIRSLQNIDNKYVIRLIDHGETDKYYFIVMEQLKGGITLEQFIAENLIKVSMIDKLLIFKKILLGIEDSHNLEIIHRDLNPSNILIDDEFNIKIIDFGISKIKKYIYEERMTVSNNYTHRYASPEQLNGLERIGKETDVFSLGAILYFMFIGEAPLIDFTERMELISKNNVSDQFINIIRKSMAVDPLDRYRTVRGLINDVEEEINSIQSENEVVYFQITQGVISALFSLGKIYYPREDLAYSYIIKNIEEAYIYKGQHSSNYVLIGDRMKYYCDIKINDTIILIKNCDKLNRYSDTQREIKKAIKFSASLRNGAGVDSYGKSMYLSSIVKQANTESLEYALKQKLRSNEIKLMDVWDKTIQAQDNYFKEKENIGYYKRIEYDAELNLVQLEISDIDSYEKLELGSELSIPIRKKNKYKNVGIVEEINTEESQILLIPAESFDIYDFPNEGNFGMYATKDKIHNDRYRKALDDFKYRRSENKRLMDIIVNPQIAKYDESKKIEPINPKIDKENIEIVEKALSARDLFLIQGPPGTGKTTVIEEIIHQILKKNEDSKILIASQSHVAVDNILEKISQNYDRSKIVRIGESQKIAESSEENKIKEQINYWTKHIKKMSAESAEPFLNEIAGKTDYPFKKIFNRELYDSGENNNEDFDSDQFISELTNEELKGYSLILKDWYKKLNSQEQFDDLLVSRANIVFSTCTAASNLGRITKNKFDCVIIDEAAKSTLPEVLIPMVRGEKIILVGDHKQLPPIVNNINEQGISEKELEKSLFEELFERTDDRNIAVSLSKQFRMHPNIAEMIRRTFYNGKILKSGVIEEERVNFSRWKNNSIMWLSTSTLSNREENRSNDKAYSNICEAEIILKELIDLNSRYKEKNETTTVGVISGYNGQKSLLKKIINPNSTKWTNLVISIENIDAYQGAEVDIVFYSVVRSNMKNKIGFLKDDRRLNVSLSRAKNLLVIVGDDIFLQEVSARKHNYFSDVLTYISRNEGCDKEDIK